MKIFGIGQTVGLVEDARPKFGVQHIDMPATPEKIWRAMQSAA